jgi:beta-glucosidase
MLRFPSEFSWGVSSAAYSIEGAWDEDGKGESIWDRFAHRAGNIADGSTGDVACDHYHRMPEDVALMAELGVNAYRFSISWPRIFPEGAGRLNPKGLDFYSRLVDALRARGIEPFPVLYQWDLPQALQERGGWENPDTPNLFAEYARALCLRLGDRVRHWITHNEPFVPAMVGYLEGAHPPGIKDPQAALEVSRQILLSHGLALRALREERAGARVGLSTILFPVHPAGEGAGDREAARRYDAYFNRWFLDPLFRGSFPEELAAWFRRKGLAVPELSAEQAELVSAPIDFLGVCYFSRFRVRKSAADPLLEVEVVQPPPERRSEMGWEIYPEGIHEALKRVAAEYAPPEIYVSENGIALADRSVPGGSVRDEPRSRFLAACLSRVHRALREGVPVKGYWVWSLLDNLEWDLGLSRRFGLVHVDYATLRRTPKRSFAWYRKVVGSATLEAETAGEEGEE